MKRGWQVEVKGNPMVVLHQKLKLLKPVLKDFNKEHYSNISDRVLTLREKLDQIQRNILVSKSVTDLEIERSLKLEILEMCRAEEAFYRQKSRVLWLQEGDLNTKFFSWYVKEEAKETAHCQAARSKWKGALFSS